MTDTVVIALPRFIRDANRIAEFLGADVLEYRAGCFPGIFPAHRIVALMSMGIVIRGIAPHLTDKWTDPAVVVVTPDFRYAIPLIGGHHGANELAGELAGLGLVPVISTATEATGRDSVEAIACGLTAVLSTAIRHVRSMPGYWTGPQRSMPSRVPGS